MFLHQSETLSIEMAMICPPGRPYGNLSKASSRKVRISYRGQAKDRWFGEIIGICVPLNSYARVDQGRRVQGQFRLD